MLRAILKKVTNRGIASLAPMIGRAPVPTVTSKGVPTVTRDVPTVTTPVPTVTTPVPTVTTPVPTVTTPAKPRVKRIASQRLNIEGGRRGHDDAQEFAAAFLAHLRGAANLPVELQVDDVVRLAAHRFAPAMGFEMPVVCNFLRWLKRLPGVSTRTTGRDSLAARQRSICSSQWGRRHHHLLILALTAPSLPEPPSCQNRPYERAPALAPIPIGPISNGHPEPVRGDKPHPLGRFACFADPLA